MRRTRLRIAALIFALCITAAAQAPGAHKLQVEKIDPPNWWTAMKTQPMLLLSGSGFTDADITTAAPGVHILRSEPSRDGNYFFAWIEIAPAAKPGRITFRVHNKTSATTFVFPLLARAKVAARFSGVSQDDVLYRIPAQSPSSAPAALQPRSFVAITERLPYLKSLGITTLSLPLACSPIGDGAPSSDKSPTPRAPGCADYYAADASSGHLEDLNNLVLAAHQSGLKVVIDFLADHTSAQHPWVQHPPTGTWFNGTPEHHQHPDSDLTGLVDPHGTRAQYRDVLEGWTADSMPDLNVNDAYLAEYLVDNAVWWTESTGIDGLSLQSFPHSQRSFWSRWHRAVKQEYPHLWTAAEVMNTDPWTTSFFAGGRKQWDSIDSGASTVFDSPLEATLRDVMLHGGSAKRLFALLQHDSLYPDAYGLVTLLNEDEHIDARVQVPFHAEKGVSIARMNAATALLLTLRGVPQIYAGDEADPPSTSSAAGTPSTSAASNPGPVFRNTQLLLKLRHDHEALRKGMQTDLAADDHSFVFVRQSGEDNILVALNSGDSDQTIKVPLTDTTIPEAKTPKSLYGNGQATIANKILTLTLPATSVVILQLDADCGCDLNPTR